MSCTPDDNYAALARLIEVSDPRRVTRASDRPVESVKWDGHQWTAVAKGSDFYYPSITLGGRRAWSCTCPDKLRRGRTTGPCKHAISLAIEGRRQLEVFGLVDGAQDTPAAA